MCKYSGVSSEKPHSYIVHYLNDSLITFHTPTHTHTLNIVLNENSAATTPASCGRFHSDILENLWIWWLLSKMCRWGFGVFLTVICHAFSWNFCLFFVLCHVFSWLVIAFSLVRAATYPGPDLYFTNAMKNGKVPDIYWVWRCANWKTMAIKCWSTCTQIMYTQTINKQMTFGFVFENFNASALIA